MTSGGSLWQWDRQQRKWQLLNTLKPDFSRTDRTNDLIGVVPLDGNAFGIVRHQPFAYVTTPGFEDEIQSDKVANAADHWREISNAGDLKFLTATIRNLAHADFLCTNKGRLLQITTEAVTIHNAPANCEAMAQTSSGDLLVSFKSLGVYQLTAGIWKQLLPPPYPSGAGEYWTYLAEDNGEIAYSVVTKPTIEKRDPALSQLWIWKNGNLLKVNY